MVLSGGAPFVVKWKPLLLNTAYGTLLATALHATLASNFSPISWAVVSLNCWCSLLLLKGWREFDVWERRVFLWSMVSILSFVHFLLTDLSFTGWSSVYYFCGPSMEYCNANYSWNLKGWRKATALWNFGLSSALGVQRLLIEVGLGGLLPGEEAIPRECFVSIVWRLIPFWLNKWESNFGAECSSILFELPHFALELLVILPMVQILAGRMRIIANPHLRAPDVVHTEDDVQDIVPDVLRCTWVVDVSQRSWPARLRANRKVLALIALVTALAAGNALVVPLFLENTTTIAKHSSTLLYYKPEFDYIMGARNMKEDGTVYFEKESGLLKFYSNSSVHACVFQQSCNSTLQENMISWMIKNEFVDYEKRTEPTEFIDISLHVKDLHVEPFWAAKIMKGHDKSNKVQWDRLSHLLVRNASWLDAKNNSKVAGFREYQDLYQKQINRTMQKFEDGIEPALFDFLKSYIPEDLSRFYEICHQHIVELTRMMSPEHRKIVPLVEGALAIMRLSCERWFPLLAVFLGFVVYRDPPIYVRRYIRLLARVCRLFQQAILLSFPAVCWGYGAGAVFSTFASIVFWAGPVLRLIEKLKRVATEVRPVSWHPATEEEVERMGGNCAICWGDILSVSGSDENRSMGLFCGHAYHEKCLLEWLHSCYGQSRRATCPMCQSQIELQIKYKMVYPFRNIDQADHANENNAPQDVAQEGQQAFPGIVALAGQMPDEFIGRFEIPIARIQDHGLVEEMNDENAVRVARPNDIPIRREHQPQQILHHNFYRNHDSNTESEQEDMNDTEGVEIHQALHALGVGSEDSQVHGAESATDGEGSVDPPRRSIPFPFRYLQLHDRNESDRPGDHGAIVGDAPSRFNSANALIFEDQQSSSSIHLPDNGEDVSSRRSDHHASSTTTVEDATTSRQQNRGANNRLQGIYARLRPRRHRRTEEE